MEIATATLEELRHEETRIMSLALTLIERAIEVQMQAHQLRITGQAHTTTYERCWEMLNALTSEHNELYEEFMRIHHALEVRGILTPER